MRSSAMIPAAAASHAALSGHQIQENTTVSASFACTAFLKSVTLPSITSSPQFSTVRSAPYSAKTGAIFLAISR